MHVLTVIVMMIFICAGDNKVVEPDPLSEGFTRYAQSNMEHSVFEFLLNYVRRIKLDSDWRKLLKKSRSNKMFHSRIKLNIKHFTQKLS